MGFEVVTAFVGQGAKIKITAKSEKGRDVGQIMGVIDGNKFIGEFLIPDDMEIDDRVFLEVDLPKNGILGVSNTIPVIPPIRFSRMNWSVSEARRDEMITPSSDVTGLRDDTEVKVIIYEYDRDNVHDKITELLATVVDGRIEVEWKYQYIEDTDEIPTEEKICADLQRILFRRETDARSGSERFIR